MGVLLSILPLSVYSMIHFGTVVPPHIGSHSALLTEHWFATRSALLARWFVPDSLATAELWGLALLALLALGWFGVKSRRDGRAFLAGVALIDIALVVLTAPNDGGGQWGPRYLLFAFAPAAVLAAGVFEAAARRQTVGILAVVLALGAGVWAQREGYRELRGTKLTYGRILDFVRLEVPAARLRCDRSVVARSGRGRAPTSGRSVRAAPGDATMCRGVSPDRHDE